MFSRFFIDRPIFATVISIVIVILGTISIPILPIEKTPDITPPTVIVTAVYPGADAQTIAETVATPLEEQINGVEDMLYMSSQSSDDGSMSITVTFEVGADIDMATILVQNRVSMAESSLPSDVIREGINVSKRSNSIIMLVDLISPEKTYDSLFMSNYINTQIKDVLTRVDGVDGVIVFGAKDFGMRVWMDPEKLKARNLTPQDVVEVIREQNVQVAAGQIGAPPIENGLNFQYTLKARGRLVEQEEFENIIVKVEDGKILRLKDVARVELGSQSYNTYTQRDGEDCVSIGIFQLPGANALEISNSVHEEMKKLSVDFPKDVEFTITYDAAKFITASLKEVVQTLFLTVILVILTVMVFLEDFRATLIPTITIPVSIIGTFAVMYALGMSINTLTLFGLVLVIGIVVDDAIVVVENTMRIMEEEKLNAKDATKKAMLQVTGPVVATTLVLLAVFVPTALIGGVSGRLYSQFALTISIATVFSSINALTLSPALCGILLRPVDPSKRNFFFRWFNRFFSKLTNGYMIVVNSLLRRTFYAMAMVVVMVILTVAGLKVLPSSFLPNEDEGYFMSQIQLPEGASLERTRATIDNATHILENTLGVAHYITIGGFSIFDNVNASSRGTVIAIMDPWDDRKEEQLHVENVVANIDGQFKMLGDGFGVAFAPPPIIGLGFAGGFEMQIQDTAGLGMEALHNSGKVLQFAGFSDPVLASAISVFNAEVPQLRIDIDRERAKSLDVPLTNIYYTLQASLGGLYVNDFTYFGRTFKVMAQSDQEFRTQVEDVLQLEVRNNNGGMVPLKTLLKVKDAAGPQVVTHFNLFPSTMIMGQPKPGYSSGEAMDRATQICDKQFPAGMKYTWSGISFQEREAGSKGGMIFFMGAIFVFLFLAAQYESWSIPIAIILAIPVAIFGAVMFTLACGYDNNTYTQIGLVLLVGLASKTAILLVEFAKQHHEEGHTIFESAIAAARLRFRPILMTALSFVFGVFPLVIATGAGAAARRSLGTAVFGGMLVATVLGVFLMPVFYLVIQKATEKTIELEHKIEDNLLHNKD